MSAPTRQATSPPWRHVRRARRTLKDWQISVAAVVIVGALNLASFELMTIGGRGNPPAWHLLVGLLPTILFAAWLFSSSTLRSLRRLGYESIQGDQAALLRMWFGRKGLRRLPPREETLILPGRAGLDDFLWIRALLTLALWDRDPRHFHIMERGYRQVTRREADALIDRYGEWWAQGLPHAESWSAATLEKWGGQFGLLLWHFEKETGKVVPNRVALLRAAGALEEAGADEETTRSAWHRRLVADGEFGAREGKAA